MDPNTTLKRLRELVTDEEADPAFMAELFAALDEWLSKGGSLPDAWKR